MNGEIELRAAPGFIEEALQSELPGLRLDWLTLEGRRLKSPEAVVGRLHALSNRYRGANVVALRAQPIPHAYRTFFRQIGLDPDVTRVPSEEAAVNRLVHGQFRSIDLVHDATLIALVETGVPVWALDADLLDASGLGIRTSVEGDRLGAGELSRPLPPGRLVVADAQSIHAILFGELAPGREVSGRTRRIALFTVAVEGVPSIHVEEALWLCLEVLGAN